ncbi:FAD synthase-like [Aricia agestis]|uniref:FAD synthase-like n=1 Tax=Aricia agestis TaxID=91739 RepID=UPI001C20225D|nr:FAD synthase-like [Aricia agestis]
MDTEDFADALQESEQVLRECFTKFQLDEVLFSFNGGKDCTVLLDLTIKVLKEFYKSNEIDRMKIVYIRTKGPFREIEDFVKEIEEYYNVKLMVCEGEMKSTLEKILKEDPVLEACLMGTRRTDPYSESLQFMQKTDAGWPQIIRVLPLLNWSYHQIWSYIFKHKVPYCSLYDRGYTSIGSVHNTRPNPALQYTDECGRAVYRPAHTLADATLERAGRGIINGH